MAKYFLINTVTGNFGAGLTRLLPGTVIDDVQMNSALVSGAGGELWPFADATVAAAALSVTAARLHRGVNEAQMESLMRSAAELSVKATATTELASQIGATDIAPLLGSTTVQGQLDALKATRVFTYQPGGTASSGVYVTWAAFVAAIASFSGSRRGVIDSQFGAATFFGIKVALVPVGAWNLNPLGGDVTLVGAVNGQYYTVLQTAAAAVSINGVFKYENLLIDNHSTIDLITLDGTEGSSLYLEDSSLVQDVSALGAIIKSTLGGGVVSKGTAIIGSFNGGTNSIQCTGGTLDVTLFDTVWLRANQLLKSGGGALYPYVGGDVIFDQQAGAQSAADTPSGGYRKSGVATITASGETAAIGAHIKAGSIITLGIQNPISDALTVKHCVKAANLTVGPLGVGSFKISALTATGGGDLNTADRSTIYWHLWTP